MDSRKTTGFPSPAQGYEKETFDFNKILIRHPAATYTMRYTGPDCTAYHIQQGDLLIIDSSLTPRPGLLAVVSDDSELVCRIITADTKSIFGIVTAVVRML